MASTQLTTRQPNGAITPAQTAAGALMEQVVIGGDLANLTPTQRLTYYNQVCDSLGLNPLTKPFLYIKLNDKLTLYATRDATDQLRALRGVSIKITSRELVDSVYIVTAQATNNEGRSDESIGAVPMVKENGEWKKAQSGKSYFAGDGTFSPLAPEDRANAAMKAETKSKRRVTLSICGLGWLDESEVDSIRGAERVVVQETGEIVSGASPSLAVDAPPVAPAPRMAAMEFGAAVERGEVEGMEPDSDGSGWAAAEVQPGAIVKCEVCNTSGPIGNPMQPGTGDYAALFYCPRHHTKPADQA